MDQITVTVPAVAPVAPVASKAKASRVVAKGTMQGAGVTAPVVETFPIKFKMLQGFRPQAGSHLFAHTAAVLELTGMAQGKAVPRSTLTAIMGETAIKHHTAKTWMFSATSKGVELSDLGQVNPHWLQADPELKAAYMEILTTGKTSKPMPQAYVNPIGIKPL